MDAAEAGVQAVELDNSAQYYGLLSLSFSLRPSSCACVCMHACIHACLHAYRHKYNYIHAYMHTFFLSGNIGVNVFTYLVVWVWDSGIRRAAE